MFQRFIGLFLIVALTALPARGDDYNLDASHTSTVFSISHLGISFTYGRFNDVEGAFSVDPADPSKSSFKLTIKADSIDTGNAKRDDHLRSPDFLNTKQFPLLTFESTAVKAGKTGLEVTGNLNMHGVAKSVTFPLVGGKTAEFPKGVHRIGYTAQLTLKRTDFGMSNLVGPVGEDVHIAISFEGVKK